MNNLYEIVSNENIAKDVYKMILKGDTSKIYAPGQFINIKVPDFYLRRPISICDYDENTITIIYKIVGNGTDKMAKMVPGETLDCLVALGNGYNLRDCVGDIPLLIGGGCGTPPLYGLAKALLKQGKKPIAVLGFNSKCDVFYEEEFKALGIPTYVSTADGTYATSGFVTDIIKNLEEYTYYYTCGPMPMFKAVYNNVDCSGQYSLESRMGCGFGACMGCSIQTKDGNRRICKDGPVFKKESIIFENL